MVLTINLFPLIPGMLVSNRSIEFDFVNDSAIILKTSEFIRNWKLLKDHYIDKKELNVFRFLFNARTGKTVWLVNDIMPWYFGDPPYSLLMNDSILFYNSVFSERGVIKTYNIFGDSYLLSIVCPNKFQPYHYFSSPDDNYILLDGIRELNDEPGYYHVAGPEYYCMTIIITSFDLSILLKEHI